MAEEIRGMERGRCVRRWGLKRENGSVEVIARVSERGNKSARE